MIKIKRLNDNFHFQASNKLGNTMDMDNAGGTGEPNKGIGPMDALLAAIGGCSGIDIVIILKKMKQQIDSFEMEIEGDRENEADHTYWKTIHTNFILTGNLDPAKVRRAIDLSIEKYCSVSKALEKSSEISYTFTINGVQIE